MKRVPGLFLIVVLVVSFFTLPVRTVKAAIPAIVNYQGRLKDAADAPLSGQYDFRFRLYDDVLKTTLLWGPEEHANQSVSNGYFDIQLGSITTFASAGLDFTDRYWLTLEIKENAAGLWDTETDPPVSFNAYAYALNAEKVVSASGEVNVGTTIQGGAALVGAETALSINTGAGFSGDLLTLSNNGTNYLTVDSVGDAAFTGTTRISMENNAVNDLIGLKIIQTNDAGNYSGSILELKGSGPDYTNNVYFGKYGDGFWVTDWAGNGVLATDQDLVLGSMGSTDATNPNVDPRILFQVGGGYNTPITTAILEPDNFNFLPYDTVAGATSSMRFSELVANGSNYVGLKAADNIVANQIWTLPNADGLNGEVLNTNGSGGLSWVDPSTFVENIYNIDGILTTDRTVDLNDNNLFFSSGDQFQIQSFNNPGDDYNEFNLTKTYAGFVTYDGAGDHINFEISPGAGMILIDTIHDRGAVYAADYSANYTNRSLVDKEYVDSVVPSVANAIYNDAGTLKLGGDLTEQTYINHQGNSLIVREFAGETETEFNGDNFKIIKSSIDREVLFGIAGVDHSGLSFEGLTNQHDLYYRDDSIYIGSNAVAFEGLQYALDYSANYTDRSLIDKGYVDSHTGLTTMQGAVDNSIAASGIVYYDSGAVEFEDDGGAAKVEVPLGGYEYELRDASTGSVFAMKSDSAAGADDAYFKFTDNRIATRGIEYNADYSAGFTNRSLVDKEYVDDSIVSSTIIAGNGITDNAGTFNLGDTLTGDVEIYGDSGNYYFDLEDLSAFYAFATDGSFESSISADSTGFQLVHNSGVNQYGLYLNPVSGFLIEDTIDNKGIAYVNDYSANYTARSLVDKEYVDGLSVSLWDADVDTGIQVEETADEDIIRFDTAGLERMIIQSTGEIFLSGGDLKTDRWLTGDTYNTFIGLAVAGAGNLSHTAGYEGWHNTGVGAAVLNEITTGGFNTALGSVALMSNTEGYDNTAVGFYNLYSNTTGINNTAVGSGALSLNTIGEANTAIGRNAMGDNVDGFNNTAIGRSALASNIDGNSNVIIGDEAGEGLTSSHGNVVVGEGAARNVTSMGNENILIGYETGDTLDGSNNIFIGNNINDFGAGQSGNMSIGNLIFGQGLTATGTTISTGNVGIGQNAPETTFHVDSNAVNAEAILTLENTAGNVQLFRVDVDPEGVLSGVMGDLAIDTTNGNIYIKQIITGPTGWLELGAGGSSSGVSSVSLTTATPTGSFSSGGFVGYEAGNDICNAEFAGSHFCRTDEIIEYIAGNSAAGFTDSTTAWVAEGPPGYTSNSNDCAGWTDSDNTKLGAFWAFDTTGGGMGWLTNCAVTKPVACCQ